jgi:hypothetical protein
LLLFLPQIFWFSILLWTLIGFSLCANVSSILLLNIFGKYMEKTT